MGSLGCELWAAAGVGDEHASSRRIGAVETLWSLYLQVLPSHSPILSAPELGHFFQVCF